MIGVVKTFDEYVGLGEVTSTEGVDYPFHCTQIADGSRTIAIGANVEFKVVERHKGPEAFVIKPA